MRTVSGRMVDIMDLKPSDIDILDICHNLSHSNRFGGATRYPYSVGQHSCLISSIDCPTCPGPDRRIHRKQKFAHDWSEAYWGDMPRPMKYLDGMQAYRDGELYAQSVIFKVFGLPEALPPCVHDADNKMLVAEGIELMNYDYRPQYGQPADVRIERWTPEYTREEFMRIYRDLFLS
jgi:hypothetical protein